MMKSKHIKQTNADRLYDIVILILISLLLLIILYPLWFVIIASVSNSSEVMKGNVIFWPKEFSFEAYEKVLQDPKIVTCLLYTSRCV